MNTSLETARRALGNRIRELRQQRSGRERDAFAAQCGLDAGLLEQIENGNVDMTISVVAAIAANLEIEIATMLEGVV
jgi:transcriptional regulator with XRE-family HTH domain